jgi:hypothetical protein
MPADNVTLTSSNFKRLLDAAFAAPPRAGDISPVNRGVRAMLAAACMANILFAGSVPVWQLYLALLSIPLAMTAIVGWDPVQHLWDTRMARRPAGAEHARGRSAAPVHGPGVVEPLRPRQASRPTDDHPSRRAA